MIARPRWDAASSTWRHVEKTTLISNIRHLIVEQFVSQQKHLGTLIKINPHFKSGQCGIEPDMKALLKTVSQSGLKTHIIRSSRCLGYLLHPVCPVHRSWSEDRSCRSINQADATQVVISLKAQLFPAHTHMPFSFQSP